jgi:diacylglycerol kinase (ATP)
MLAVIINPRSGKKHLKRQRHYLMLRLEEHCSAFTTRDTEYKGHATEIARDFVESGCNTILVWGGDGTISETVNGIMTADIPEEKRKNIRLGLIPRGTGNDFGRFWGLTKNYRRSLDIFFDGRAQPLDVGRLTYFENGIEKHRYFINSIGYGVDPLTCVYADKLKPFIGSHHLNYLFGLIAAVFRQRPIPVTLKVDGTECFKAGLFTMNVGNGPYSGGGIRQNPDADPRDGIFNAMFVEKPTLGQLFKALPNLFNGHLTDVPVIHTIKGSEIEIETEESIVVETDGILMNYKGNGRLNCIHNAIKFII